MSEDKELPTWLPAQMPRTDGYEQLSGPALVLLYGRLREYRFIPMTHDERNEWITRLARVERHLIWKLG